MMTNEIHELKVHVNGPDQQSLEMQLERLTWRVAVLRIFVANALVWVSRVFSALVVAVNGIPIYFGKTVMIGVFAKLSIRQR
jgi:hypothetical protein